MKRHSKRLGLAVVSLLAAGCSDPTAPMTQASARKAILPPAWRFAAPMKIPQEEHAAVALQNGKILVVGGMARSADGSTDTSASTVQLFDPAVGDGCGAWTFAPTLGTYRARHMLALLGDGRVLAAGGEAIPGPFSPADVFDPAAGGGAGGWVATGPMRYPRDGAAGTRLLNGTVLVVGGAQSVWVGGGGSGFASRSEAYDPQTNAWVDKPLLTEVHRLHTATLLPTGEVFVFGSDRHKYGDIFTPGGGGAWRLSAPAAIQRERHTATLLNDGRVLIVGGLTPAIVDGHAAAAPAQPEIFDPAGNGGLGTWRMAAPMHTPRTGHTATLLPDGRVLVAGGSTDWRQGDALRSVEIFDPAGGAEGTWTQGPPLNVDRTGHVAALLPSGEVLVAGGRSYSPSLRHLASAEIYGVPAADPLRVEPATASVPPRGAVSFSAVGACGAVTWSVQTASGGKVDPATGAYTAGAQGLARDIVQVVSAEGASATAVVDVTAGASVQPATLAVVPRGRATFTAAGGSGTGWTWRLSTNASAGAIDDAGGYTAGPVGSVADVVEAVDSLGNSATAVVDVTAGASVQPATLAVAPRGRATFTAAGGSGTGWTWRLSTNASGGAIDDAGGYAAGPVGSVTDVVEAVDSLGNSATAVVDVTAGASVQPATLAVAPRGHATFTAAGGSGTGWTWRLSTNSSGGAIDDAGGYAAGPVDSVTDVVEAVDSLGNSATAVVDVTAGASVQPATLAVAPRGRATFTAAGGSGTGWTWRLSTNASGGAIDATGGYAAGPVGSVTDVVEAVDSLGNSATAVVDVTAGASVRPARLNVVPRGRATFTAAGGSGTGWTWRLSTNASGGAIDATGRYTAGPVGSVTDVVEAVDSLGNSATATVLVAPVQSACGGRSAAVLMLPGALLVLARRRRSDS